MITRDELIKELSYDPNTGAFSRRKGPKKVGRVATNGYLQVMILGERHMAHRLAWLHEHGEFPDGFIDHINRDKLDNRISNLRVVTSKQNNENSLARRTNKSGYRGVSYTKGMWQADIRHNKKTIYLGMFRCKAQAARARAEAEKIYFTHAPDYPQISPCGVIQQGGTSPAPGTKCILCDCLK